MVVLYSWRSSLFDIFEGCLVEVVVCVGDMVRGREVERRGAVAGEMV